MSEYKTITDRINTVRAQNVNGRIMLDVDEVLEIVKDAVPVEIDPEVFTTDGMTDYDRVVAAAVSSAYNILADTAARLAMMHLRELAEEVGFGFRPDEEVFAEAEDVKSWRDLAERDFDELKAVGDVLQRLCDQSSRAARDAALRATLNVLEAGE